MHECHSCLKWCWHFFFFCFYLLTMFGSSFFTLICWCHVFIWGESTLWWPPLGCHIVLLSSDVHVWMYTTSNFWKSFTIFLHIMLDITLGKILEKNYFISFYKVGDWSIFVETNVMYMCTQKHKYIWKIIWMIYSIYETWRYIEPCHFT
jgi:hypothetical protein